MALKQLDLPWFFPAMDKDDAFVALKDTPPGTFLLRRSSLHNTLALSVRTYNSVLHSRIFLCESGLLYLDAPARFRHFHENLESLVCFYRSGNRKIFPVNVEGEVSEQCFRLTYPMSEDILKGKQCTKVAGAYSCRKVDTTCGPLKFVPADPQKLDHFQQLL